MVPPDPMPNSEVKRRDADGSVGISHVRVGHRQVLFFKFIHRVNLKNNFGSNSAVAPPDPMPNSEVKCCNADGSVGFSHVRVGHCQSPYLRSGSSAG